MRISQAFISAVTICLVGVYGSPLAYGTPSQAPAGTPAQVGIQRVGSAAAVLPASGESAAVSQAASEPLDHAAPPPRRSTQGPAALPIQQLAGHTLDTSNCTAAPSGAGSRFVTCFRRRRAAAQTPALSAMAARQQPQSASPNSVIVGGGVVPFPQGCTTAFATPDRVTTCIHEFETWNTLDVTTRAVVGTQEVETWEVWVTDPVSLTIRHGLQVATRAATGVFVTGGGATVSIVNPCVGGRVLANNASCTATEQYPSVDPTFVQPNTFMGNQWVETSTWAPTHASLPPPSGTARC